MVANTVWMVGLTNLADSEGMDHSSLEAGRGFRQKKKFAANGPKCCPVCEVTIRPGEFDAHLSHEINRLQKLTDSNRMQRRILAENQGLSRPINGSPMSDQGGNRVFRGRGLSNESLEGGPTTSGSTQMEVTASDSNPDRRRNAYLQIKSNRQGRLRIKKGNKRKLDETMCPICSDRLQGTAQELNSHVELCLQRREEMLDGDEDVSIEVDDMYEEYEWAGQQRIRTSTLLDRGLAGTGMATVNSRPSPTDEDVDLVVDVVDSNAYGPAQYSEVDIVLPMAEGPEEEKNRAALRAAVINPTPTPHKKQKTSKVNQETPSESSLAGAKKEEVKPSTSSHQLGDAASSESSSTLIEAVDVEMSSHSSNHILDALKERIKELEGESRCGDSGSCKCLICMEHYVNPVISVCCWHVHCEACWLHTLGAKKLCPQCNMITSPSDLRKIYI